MSQADVLLVEDEAIAAEDIREMIEDCGHTVVEVVDSVEEMLAVIHEEPVDLVVLDIRLPGDKDGIDGARMIQEDHEVPIVYLTAYSDEETLSRAKSTQPAGFLIKPVTQADLEAALQLALPESVK